MSLPELLDVAGVAERCGLRRQSVRAYLGRGTIPEPDYRLNGGPVWRAAIIDAWQADRVRWHNRQTAP